MMMMGCLILMDATMVVWMVVVHLLDIDDIANRYIAMIEVA